ncbi:MAG: hypothetical protein FJZ08_02420 [Candidatus Omnitrophica bacterium]|nr:hypothetical protein [Candidatus Omnitrophota bacterium]
MRLSRFLALTFFITSFSLLYVWQQTEIFRLAYIDQSNFTTFQDLLDKNTVLRYNMGKNTSLVRIASRLDESLAFQMPQGYHLVRLTGAKDNPKLAKQAPQRESLAFRLFGIKRQAEAKTINP